jgi:hypothetical protein
VRENPRGICHVLDFWTDEVGEAGCGNAAIIRNRYCMFPIAIRLRRFKPARFDLQAFYRRTQNDTFDSQFSKIVTLGCETPIHFAGWREFRKSINTKSILNIEGAIKAEIVNKFLPKYFAIANSIGCAQDLIVSISRGKSMMIAFDSDYHQNPSVIKQLAKFLRLRFSG